MGRRDEARRDHERTRRKRAPWRKLYYTRRWKRLREAQLHRQPLCEYCLREGRSRRAEVVNHATPHRGDETLFFSSRLESCCKQCHDARVQRIEQRGYDSAPGDDGWPVDPHHPFNRKSSEREPE